MPAFDISGEILKRKKLQVFNMLIGYLKNYVQFRVGLHDSSECL